MQPSPTKICRRGLAAVATLAAIALSATTAVAETTWERIQRTGVVRVGTDGAPPLAVVNPDGTLGGQSPLTLIRALEPLGVVTTWEAVKMDFGSLIPALMAGRIDVIASSMSIRPARCEQVSFGEPDYTVARTLLVQAGNPHGVHSLEDIAAKGLTVAALQGGVEIEMARTAGIPEEKIVTFPDMPAVVMGLQSNRADASTLSRIYVLKIPAFTESDLEFADPYYPPKDALGNEIGSGYTGIAFRKEDADFLQAYNAGLEALKESGALLQIIEETDSGSTEALPPVGITTADICKPPQ